MMASAKPAAVGAFVLGAIMLGVAAILVFGGMRLFSRTARVVVYFQGSVQGLAIGSPVTFRGVKIGTVEGLRISVDGANLKPVIPVQLDLDPQQISWAGGAGTMRATELRRAVDAGLRAELSTQSLVTGQLSVDLDFHPDAPAAPVGPAGDEVQIPSIPSEVQHFKDQLLAIDLPALATKTQQTLTSLSAVLDAFQTRIGPLFDNVQQTVIAARTTLETATAALREVQTDAARSMDNIDQLAIDSRRLVNTSGKELDRVLATAERAATQADTLIASLNAITAPRSPMRGDLEASLRDLAASAGSLRAFTRDVERNPAGTLLGKAER